MADKGEVVGRMTGPGPYGGFSYSAIPLKVTATTIAEAEDSLLSFMGELAEVLERHPGVELLTDRLRESVTALRQNLELMEATLQRETSERGRDN